MVPGGAPYRSPRVIYTDASNRRTALSGGHAHGLFHHGHGKPYELPPQCKIVAAFAFVVAVVVTPREAFAATALYMLILALVARAGEIPFRFVLRRLTMEVPFIAFAVFLPFVVGGEEVRLLGVGLSEEGLWAMWNIMTKATVSFATMILVAATTTTAQLLHGLEHLRMPRTITSVAGFMVRYLDVVGGEMRRMKIARESRAYSPRFIWQARALAGSAGVLFIRSYERGERVHQAMLSRGYDGSLPVSPHRRATPSDWVISLSVPIAAAIVAIWANLA